MRHEPTTNEPHDFIPNTQINYNLTSTSTPDPNQVNDNSQGKTDPLGITTPNTNNHDISKARTDHN